MLPLEYPDRIHIAFDDHRLVATIPGCSFPTRWPSTWVCPNWSSSASTWAMPRVGRTRATRL